MKLDVKQILLFFTIILLIMVSKNYSQIVYVHINDNVYIFLDRMNIKNIIQLNSEKKPFSRKYIAEKLTKIEIKKTRLNKVESESLKWYKREYSHELRKIDNILIGNYKLQTNNEVEDIKEKTHNRWRLFSYDDSLFSFDISPIILRLHRSPIQHQSLEFRKPIVDTNFDSNSRHKQTSRMRSSRNDCTQKHKRRLQNRRRNDLQRRSRIDNRRYRCDLRYPNPKYLCSSCGDGDIHYHHHTDSS